MMQQNRTVFLTPPVRSADLVCTDAPTGVLPHGTSNEVASDRIVGIAESGDDCRQTVHRNHDKLEVYENIVSQLNKQAGVKVKQQ